MWLVYCCVGCGGGCGGCCGCYLFVSWLDCGVVWWDEYYCSGFCVCGGGEFGN